MLKAQTAGNQSWKVRHIRLDAPSAKSGKHDGQLMKSFLDMLSAFCMYPFTYKGALFSSKYSDHFNADEMIANHISHYYCPRILSERSILKMLMEKFNIIDIKRGKIFLDCLHVKTVNILHSNKYSDCCFSSSTE